MKLKPVEIKDLLTYRYPENLTYSPDGKTLAFTLAKADEEKNNYRRDIWIIRDGEPVQLTSAFSSSIVFWKDDTHLIIRRQKEESDPSATVLYEISLNGGEADEWLTLPFAVTAVRKIREDLYAVSGMIDKNDPDGWKKSAEEKKKEAEEKKKAGSVQVVDEIPYWFNGAGFTNGKRTALFTVETGKKTKIRRITSAKFDMGEFIVEDGTVYYTGNVRDAVQSLYAKVFAYTPETGKKETLYKKADHNIYGLFRLEGKLYALASDMKAYGVNQTPDFVRIEDGKLMTVLEMNRQLGCAVAGDTLLGGGKAIVKKDNQLYVIATEEDHSAVWKYNSSFEKTVLLDEPGMVKMIEVGEDGIAFVRETADSLGEVWMMNRDGSNLRALTDFNKKALKNKFVALPQRIEYESGGFKLHGWVLLPQDYEKKKKVPAVLDIHGGPRTVYGEVFFHEMQVWVSRGYAVMFTNIPGSDGRGDAFADLRGKYGTIDYDALMAFTDAVLAKYKKIDPDRLCETGGSYGGFMTNWIITHTDRFCCAASQRSIANWVSMAFISDIGPMFCPDQCDAQSLYGDENTRRMWERSPLRYAENCKTPTLLIHSDEDYRCPLPEGMQMMQALCANNVETRLVIFHGENHDLSRSGKPLNRIRRLKEITGWFDRHTGI
ncbi:MAG: S9 family peptidase [Erysipelotrichaceae bacterium]|nr:S9 family peptidase [Erysipelotrichaceae bacterium]